MKTKISEILNAARTEDWPHPEFKELVQNLLDCFNEKLKAVEYRFGTGNIKMSLISRKNPVEHGMSLLRVDESHEVGEMCNDKTVLDYCGVEGETFIMCDNKESALALLETVKELVAKFD